MTTLKHNALFAYTRAQRKGLFLLIFLIVLLQLSIYYQERWLAPPEIAVDKDWLALQSNIDSIKAHPPQKAYRRYPFNPNFITDFKGYQLGMKVIEIDRLHAFRNSGKFVNSARDFQKVTQVSDSLLAALSPYFQFPEWVTRQNARNNFAAVTSTKALPVRDINSANKTQLMEVNGIGEALSERILSEREKLGGFVSMLQIAEIWGIRPDVAANVTKSFSVKRLPEVRKIKVNEASAKELMALPYFKYALAKSIITHRSMYGKIQNADELSKISGFPVDKINFIALYLDF